MFTCTFYDTYIDVKLSLILTVNCLHDQLWKHVILHEVATLNESKTSPTDEWLFRVASVHIIGHGRSVMLPEVVGRVSLYVSSPGVDTWEKTIKERYSMHGD